jgi:hypothetical protein
MNDSFHGSFDLYRIDKLGGSAKRSFGLRPADVNRFVVGPLPKLGQPVKDASSRTGEELASSDQLLGKLSLHEAVTQANVEAGPYNPQLPQGSDCRLKAGVITPIGAGVVSTAL